MDKVLEKTSGWRGSADLWIGAAYRALIAGGVEAVKVGPLAAGLGLSRTSFYGHFDSREDLLAALLAQWEAVNTGSLLGRTGAWAATLPEAVLNLFDCWIDAALFDARLDMAVRAWGQGDPAVWARVENADRCRIKAVAGMFARFGMEGEEAHVRACTLYYTQIGYFALRVEEDVTRRVDRMPHYVKTFCGQAPSAAEFARFRARHGF
jgi:AcrR family transcriptional regulator